MEPASAAGGHGPSPTHAGGGGEILIVEDDPHTAALVATYLGREGFATALAANGSDAWTALCRWQPRLVVLDLMLPKLDGWELCRRIRACSEVPVLVLSARDREADRLGGFALGADDYVVKPFSPRELVARVKAILRRSRLLHARPGRLEHGSLCLEPDRRRVLLGGAPVDLTPSEYVLLSELMSQPGRVFTREELIASLYPDGGVVVDRVVDVHIGKLRKKIGDDPLRPSFVFTVWGIGYRFAD